MDIPKVAHRIWFGEPFPEKYRHYLTLLVECNPDYVVKLWTDSRTMSDESYLELIKFCNGIGVRLCNVIEYNAFNNYDQISEEFKKASANPSHRKLHYVRASDIARINILEAEGGVYTDTDSKVIAPFGNMASSHGFLLKLSTLPTTLVPLNYFVVNNSSDSCRYFFSEVLYDFIASVPAHPLFTNTMQLIKLDYQAYHASSHLEWEKSSNAILLAWGTVKLTGTALKWTLNWMYQQGKIQLSDPNELFYDTNQMMEADYDKSWLEGFEVRGTKNKEEQDQNAFINEIDKNRQHYFSIQHHGEHPVSLQKAARVASNDSIFSALYTTGAKLMFDAGKKSIINQVISFTYKKR